MTGGVDPAEFTGGGGCRTKKWGDSLEREVGALVSDGDGDGEG